jgi:hypothetical protein
MKTNAANRRRESSAEMLGLCRKLDKSVQEATSNLSALRQILKDASPKLKEELLRHCEDLENELYPAKAATRYLLERASVQLKNDPLKKN